MLNINKRRNKLFLAVIIATSFLLASCSKDENPMESGGGTAKVAGRISSSNGVPKTLNKAGSAESTASVQGAAVILAQVQADGSLKTVSTQTVQTDIAGKFVVETNLSGTANLVVVATQGAAEWKAIVSSTVQSGNTVYAPPLCEESTTETNLYIKLVSQGRADNIDAADLKILLNAQAALQIKGNAQAETDFINAFHAQSQATAQAAGNSYFGLTSSQIQAMMHAKAEAKAKLDLALYNSGDTEDEAENGINNYEESVCTNSSVNASVYAELMRIGVTTFVNATASMTSNGRLAIAKCFSKRYAFMLNVAMKQQFQAAAATDAQISAVTAAGATLYSSISASSDLNSMADAFVQYHSTIKSQLKITLSSYASTIETVDASINSTASAKTILNASLSGTISLDVIVNAYVAFFNSIKSTTQVALVGASLAQVNAASQILILANMN